MEGLPTGEVALLQRIDGLVDFLKENLLTLNAIMNHLLTDTFFGQSAFGHILHIVRNDGSLAMPARSGFKAWPIEKIPERFVTDDTKLNVSLRTGEIVSCGSFELFSFAGPDYLGELFPKGFGASIAWPIPGIGSVLTFYNANVELTVELRLFLRTVGNIISLGLKNSTIHEEIRRDGHPDHVISRFTLTVRQWNILKSMRRGMTNPEIARNLGFSDSLVRHETMKIYRKLSINGRKELIEMPDENFPF